MGAWVSLSPLSTPDPSPQSTPVPSPKSQKQDITPYRARCLKEYCRNNSIKKYTG